MRASLHRKGFIRFHVVLERSHTRVKTGNRDTLFFKVKKRQTSWHEIYDLCDVKVFRPQSCPEIRHRLMVLNGKTPPALTPPSPIPFGCDQHFKGIEAWRMENYSCLHLATPSGILIGAMNCRIHNDQELCIEAWCTDANVVLLSPRSFDRYGKRHQGPHRTCVNTLFQNGSAKQNTLGVFLTQAPGVLPITDAMPPLIFAEWVRNAVYKQRWHRWNG